MSGLLRLPVFILAGRTAMGLLWSSGCAQLLWYACARVVRRQVFVASMCVRSLRCSTAHSNWLPLMTITASSGRALRRFAISARFSVCRTCSSPMQVRRRVGGRSRVLRHHSLRLSRTTCVCPTHAVRMRRLFSCDSARQCGGGGRLWPITGSSGTALSCCAPPLPRHHSRGSGRAQPPSYCLCAWALRRVV